MAEFGLAASVIQIAGAGLKLSKTLYQYAETVASADRRVEDTAKEVKIVSAVIRELGDIFNQGNTWILMKKDAVETASETVKELSTVFTELDIELKKTKKNTIGRLMLPFRESKIDLHRSRIEKLKSTLQLLMQVLIHAHQIATQKLDQETNAAQREEIRALLQERDKSTKRYEESLRNYLSDEELDNESTLDSRGSIMSVAQIETAITAKNLGTCVQHLQTLLKDIGALQQALSTVEGATDPFEPQQTVIESYFRTRQHLDGVLLGNPPDPRQHSGSGDIAMETRKKRGNDHTLQNTLTSSAGQINAIFAGDARIKAEKLIRFVDARGKTFDFAYHKCNTWQRMCDHIKKVLRDDDSLGPDVSAGRFDLLGPQGRIIPPADYDRLIRPGWKITMRIQASPERPETPPLLVGSMVPASVRRPLSPPHSLNVLEKGPVSPRTNSIADKKSFRRRKSTARRSPRSFSQRSGRIPVSPPLVKEYLMGSHEAESGTVYSSPEDEHDLVRIRTVTFFRDPELVAAGEETSQSPNPPPPRARIAADSVLGHQPPDITDSYGQDQNLQDSYRGSVVRGKQHRRTRQSEDDESNNLQPSYSSSMAAYKRVMRADAEDEDEVDALLRAWTTIGE